MKILYIEDHEQLAKTVQGYLQDHGHEVVWADKISRALEEMSNDRFDGIICDGTLDPKNRNDGFRFVQQLLTQGKKVVLFSTMRPVDVPEGMPFVWKNSKDAPDLLLEKLLAL
ncbi:MAG: response regulator [Candidatus Doudnabacteria bacterium]